MACLVVDTRDICCCEQRCFVATTQKYAAITDIFSTCLYGLYPLLTAKFTVTYSLWPFCWIRFTFVMIAIDMYFDMLACYLYPPQRIYPRNEVNGGILDSPCLSVCPLTFRVHPVASTVQDGFFPYLWYKWSLAWKGVSHVMTFDLDLYLQGHSALT